MNPGIPFKKQITSRGNLVNLGGNYRYRYDLCPRARTVVVTDMDLDVGTFTPLSIVSTARVATINLTAGATYYSIVYRSVAQQVWVFGTTNVIVIDANPSSVNFNTIITTHTTTAFSGANNVSITYSSINDSFLYLDRRFFAPSFPNSITYPQGPLGSVFSATNCGFFPSNNSILMSGVNSEAAALFGADDGDYKAMLGNAGMTFTPLKINNKIYSGFNNNFRRFTDRGFLEASIVITSAARGDAAYNPVTKHIVISSYNSLVVPVLTITPFTNIGNLQSAMSTILATNHSQNGSVQYCPYNGKIYIRASNINANQTGLNRYIIIDTTQVLANMVCGYRTIDEGAQVSGNMYWNTLSCFNGLRINEYES